MAFTDIRSLNTGTVAWYGARFGKSPAQTVKPVKMKYHIISSELPAVCRRYVLPVNSFTQMDNVSVSGP